MTGVLRRTYWWIGRKVYEFCDRRTPVAVITIEPGYEPRPGEIWVESVEGTKMTIRRGPLLADDDETGP